MAGKGQPPKLTPEVQQKIVDAIIGGNFIDVACGYAGVSKSSHYGWMDRARKELARLEADPKARARKSEEPYLDYLEAIEGANKRAEVRAVGVVIKAAFGGTEVKSKTTTTRTPVRLNGQIQRDANGQVLHSEKIVEESTIAPPDIKAATWWLEHRAPERWGRKRLEITGAEGGPVQTVNMSLEEFNEADAQRREQARATLESLTALDALDEPDEFSEE